MAGAQEEARRYISRKRRFYTVLVIYVALVVLWFLIDVLTGSDWWFYWPTLGAGVIVAIIGIAMFGFSGLFGAGWEKRQMDRYMERRGDSDEDQPQG
jgi:2TM domain